MKLIETLTYENIEFYKEIGESWCLTGERLTSFLDKMGLNQDVYEVKYFKDNQEKSIKKYYLNNLEVERKLFSDLALRSIHKMEKKSEKLRLNRF